VAGVTQQAGHFAKQAEVHRKDAKNWLSASVLALGMLLAGSVAILIFYKLPFFAPANYYEASQLAIGKLLVFATLTSCVVLCTKNYLAHRHNETVNNHRKNALLTYEEIVKAGGDSTNRDIVLGKAAECIFATQPTGYSKSEGADGPAISLVSMAPSALRPPDGS